LNGNQDINKDPEVMTSWNIQIKQFIARKMQSINTDIVLEDM
jgi:hypothetical protein